MGEFEVPGQFSTPIVNALARYINDGTIRFHMPGHKGRPSGGNALMRLIGNTVFKADVTNVPGMDDLHQTQSVIREAQELAAQVYGADYTYFLINGSSCGLQALIMAVCNPGDKILVPRNMHRSILSGIILSGAVPVFFTPEYDGDYGILLGVSPEAIARTLDTHPDAKAVILVSPTYHGLISDVAAIARIVHARNIPLLIDEAHGAHLRFHEGLPPTALEMGADAAVQGSHKLLPAFTQASMLHIKGNLVDRQRLEAALRLLQSTSTSYLLLASLDAAREEMTACGRDLIQEALALADYIRHGVKEIEGLSAFGKEIIGRAGVFGFDPLKVTISVKGLSITGLAAENRLREQYRIQVEMSDLLNVLLIVTCGNNQQDAQALLKALGDLSINAGANGGACNRAMDIKVCPGVPELALTPREAFFAPTATVPLDTAEGQISGEVIACYPPGIPAVCPGERLTGEIIEYLKAMRGMGMHFQGCSDATLRTIRVVKAVR